MGLLDRFRAENPEPKPDKPPTGASGRGHSGGFIELDEHNTDLQHPHGAETYDRMYRSDGDVRQVVQLVTNPIIGGTWEVEPYGGADAKEQDVKVAEFVRWALFEAMSPNLIQHLAEFLPVLVRSGFAPGELTWTGIDYEGERKLVLRKIGLRLPKTISQWEQDQHGELTRIKQDLRSAISDLVRKEGGQTNERADGPLNGRSAVSPTEKWLHYKDLVYYRLGAEGDNWEGVSLLRPAHKHWRYKDLIEKIDAIAQEREALGIPVCYPPLGANVEQLDEMEEILAAMRTNEEGYILMPGPKAGSGFAPEGQGWIVEVLGYDRTGSGRDPQPSLNYHTQKIAAAFIAEFMRLGHGETGARATAQVQADPFLMSVEAIAGIVEAQIARITKMLVAYNFAGVKNLPKVKMSLVDATNLAQLADYVQKLVSIRAIFPDQRLENFLRARADLPPADPAAVKQRGKKDSEMRNEAVVPPTPVDTFGANDKPGRQHGTKDAAGTKPGGATGATNRGRKDGGSGKG